MPKRPIEIERIILADGWIFKNQTGSHRHYIHPDKPGKVTIPFHSRELKKATELSIYRKAGISKRRCSDMTYIYPACFYQEEEGYSVVFPDLNYLATDGNTLEAAMNNAVDCLAGVLYEEEREKQAHAVPSDITELDPLKVYLELDPEGFHGNCFTSMVSVDLTAYAKEHFEKSVKKTLTIPAWLNRLALEHHVNFSKVLQDALIDMLL